MTFTRSPLMIRRYLAGKLSGFGPVDCKPTRLKLVGMLPQRRTRRNGKRVCMPFSVMAIVIEHK